MAAPPASAGGRAARLNPGLLLRLGVMSLGRGDAAAELDGYAEIGQGHLGAGAAPPAA